MSYLEGEARCPYFMYDKGNILQCEMARLNFCDKEMEKEITHLCICDNDKCPLKVALDHYYERKK